MDLYKFCKENNIEQIFNVIIDKTTENVDVCEGIIIDGNFRNQLNAVRDYIFNNYHNKNSNFFCASVKNTLIIYEYN